MFNVQAEIIRVEIQHLLWAHPELSEDEVLRADMIDGQTDFKTFLTTLVRKLADANALADGTKERLTELRERKARFERRIDWLRTLLTKTLEAADAKKVELPEATVSMRAGTQALVGDPDPDTLPDEYVRIKREPDRAKIKAALLAGVDVPGCALSNAAPSLSVFVK